MLIYLPDNDVSCLLLKNFSFPTHVKNDFRVFTVLPCSDTSLSECVVLFDKERFILTVHKHFSLTMPLKMCVIQEPG